MGDNGRSLCGSVDRNIPHAPQLDFFPAVAPCAGAWIEIQKKNTTQPENFGWMVFIILFV